MHALFTATFILSALTTVLARPLIPPSHRRAVTGWTRPHVFAGNASTPSLNMTDDQCLSSGNSTTIQSLLTGPGSSAVLCPNMTFQLFAPINFTSPNQTITTLGSPTDASRAMLVISANITAAIFGNCNDCSGDVISHIQINGNRAGLGRISSGSSALIEIGANTANQRVEFVRAFDPRGWSCMHISEGANMSCRNATIVNNDIGPCGVAAEVDFPFASVNGTGRSLIDGFPGTISSNLTSGQWADGISHACPYSLVSNNTVTDASDGGIVIFGAFGSHVVNNHIRSLNQTLLGGINMVDATPSNNYTDILVYNNTIEARENGFIKVAIGCGPAVWGDDLTSRNFGGTVTGNTFTGPNLGYGVVVSGVSNWTVQDNTAALDAVFSAGFTQSCHGLQVDPAAIVLDFETVDNSTVQPGSFGPAQFVICTESAAFLQDEEEADNPSEVPDDGNDCPTAFYSNCSIPSITAGTVSSATPFFTSAATTPVPSAIDSDTTSVPAASVSPLSASTSSAIPSSASTFTVFVTATATPNASVVTGVMSSSSGTTGDAASSSSLSDSVTRTTLYLPPSITAASPSSSADSGDFSGLKAGLGDYELLSNSTSTTGAKKPCPHPSHHKSTMRRWVAHVASMVW